MNIRDWLYVDDHISALMLVIQKGEIGESYNIGSNSEKTNLEVVNLICDLISSFKPKYNLKSINYHNLIEFVEDRPGHDKRYAIDSSKIRRELGWFAKETFESGLKKTVEWYLKNLNFLKKAYLI